MANTFARSLFGLFVPAFAIYHFEPGCRCDRSLRLKQVDSL
ncbi:Hypothetical protein BSSP2_II0231 [Brucella suis bv. 2]|nr:Hypothetical protein BSSP3_II0231 [Brucella suis bv. 2]AIB22306.1 Hypothetical protein BSPT1_II0226 [Brucella suis bv. 2]AIB25662.1 Hypothetical protein BSPT2_II0227 [Brucella suis bv. 2]AIB29053.1 Hypothetical protein BSSP1_II0226 [Brucella suis bv. 2]AIB32426.1 Hypothetical protein BSSP2_II0231 [Brucella suis bv. 2]